MRFVGGEQQLARGPEMYALRDVALFIWRRCDGRTSLERMAEEVAREYDVPLEQARSDVVAFVDELLERRLLEVDAEPRP